MVATETTINQSSNEVGASKHRQQINLQQDVSDWHELSDSQNIKLEVI